MPSTSIGSPPSGRATAADHGAGAEYGRGHAQGGRRETDLAEVARELGQSVRTLQRRLTEAGVTFQQVLAQARHELAKHYLLHSGRELNETAYLLGYADANSFFRAFQVWEGTSPNEWRTRLSKK